MAQAVSPAVTPAGSPAKPIRRKTEPPGSIINCSYNKYKVESLLGQGAMGDVYKVSDVRDPKRIYAMKTESNDVDPLNARLKVETSLYEALRRAPTDIDKSRFLHIYDKGKTRDFKFCIMELAGHSLKDVVERMFKFKVPLNSVINMARQSIRVIQELHHLGWLHRDLKPANFAVGLPPKEKVIYMMDFGTARKFRESDGKIKVPRTRIQSPFSLTYCSLRCHANLEQSRKDDMESWLYMILDFFDSSNITWWGCKDVKTIIERKRAIMEAPAEMMTKGLLRAPQPLVVIIMLINQLVFTDAPNYLLMDEALMKIGEQEKLNLKEPAAWIGKAMPEKEKKKKKKKKKKEEPAVDSPAKKTDEKKDEPEKKKEEIDEKKDKMDEKKDKTETKKEEIDEKKDKMDEKKDKTEKKKEPRKKSTDGAVTEMEKELAKIYEELGEPKTPEEIREEVRRKMMQGKEREEDEDDDEGDSEDENNEEDRNNRKRKKVQDKLKQSRHRGGRGRRNRDRDERDDDREEEEEGRDDRN